MSLKKHEKQRIVDEYLAATGRNIFLAPEFVSWLADKPDHEAYPWLFAQSDAEAAFEHRVNLARKFVSGLRIVVEYSEPKRFDVGDFAKGVVTYPAFISPIKGRQDGGGYVAFSSNEPDHVLELQRQGAAAMRVWLERYSGVFFDHNRSTLREIAAIGCDAAASED